MVMSNNARCAPGSKNAQDRKIDEPYHIVRLQCDRPSVLGESLGILASVEEYLG